MFKLNEKGFYILSFPGLPKDELRKIENQLIGEGIKCIVVDRPFEAHRLN